MPTSIDDANTRLILHELRKQSSRLNEMPTGSDVKVIVMDAIRDHEDRCVARLQLPEVARRTDEVTGVFKVLRDTGAIRRSVAPAARAIGNMPIWAKILVPLALAIISACLGVDLSM